MSNKTKLGGAALAALTSLIVWYESSGKPQLTPYKDPVGIWTDCYGHTGKDVVPGKKNTPEECLVKLQAGMAVAEAVVDKCYPDLKGNPKAAMTSMAYNMGPGRKGVKDGVCTLKSGKAPTMRHKALDNDVAGMCAEFPKWNLQKLPGITKRRAAEKALCLTPEKPNGNP